MDIIAALLAITIAMVIAFRKYILRFIFAAVGPTAFRHRRILEIYRSLSARRISQTLNVLRRDTDTETRQRIVDCLNCLAFQAHFHDRRLLRYQIKHNTALVSIAGELRLYTRAKRYKGILAIQAPGGSSFLFIQYGWFKQRFLGFPTAHLVEETAEREYAVYHVAERGVVLSSNQPYQIL